MRNLILSAIAGTALLGATAVSPAQAAVSADINIHIGRRAPAVYFAREPRVMLIPDTEVYYVDDYDDYDMYRCDGWWYINDGGYWYRSQSYRGPWIGISFSTLPRRVLNVPIAYRHQPYRSPSWSRGYDDRYQSGRRYDDGRSWSGRSRQDDGRNWSGRSRQDDGRSWSGRSRDDDGNGDVRWRDGRNRDDQNDRDWRNGRGNGNGNGHGKGRGRGNGRGRGHGNR